ncbi:hypothetical protein [Butyrivibrio proteoclasticus]|uniref:hypothetical protein n=1 Tax=Butyrivibrio proteoclasticus TaxID=43305 RepID=UPI00047ED733|nr:hypothetical protein [Butyrivibrio proteoclasticus]
MKRTINVIGISLALALSLVAGVLSSKPMKALAEDELKEAKSCTFVIPSEFVPCAEKGLFINKNNPMESSSIFFDYFDNGKDVVLTNRERQQEEESGELEIIDDSLNMTKEIYQETISNAYNTQFGEDVGFTVTSYENITIDGYPGFKIEANYQASGQERVYQTVYILLSKYRMFTVTYQRAEDDDCIEAFEKSAATIHVR